MHRSPAPPLPLLITGIAGVPGLNALHYFQARYPGRVIGIRQRDNWKLIGEGIVPCNAEDPRAMAELFREHKFASVLDCAGNCALKSCELDPQRAWRINYEGVRNLLDVTERHPVRTVHLSVDLVYSGRKQGNYVETDPVDPVTVYGKTMAASEELIRARRPDIAILRISLPMGISSNGHAGAIDWIQSRFKKHRPATLFYDEVRTPTYTDCLNEVCEAMLANNLSGVFHAGGPRRLTLHQIAQVINRVGGYDPRLLIGCLRSHAAAIPPRAGDVSMCSQKLNDALGYEPFAPWPLDEAFVPTHANWHFDRPPGEGGSFELLSDILYRNPARCRSGAA